MDTPRLDTPRRSRSGHRMPMLLSDYLDVMNPGKINPPDTPDQQDERKPR